MSRNLAPVHFCIAILILVGLPAIDAKAQTKQDLAACTSAKTEPAEKVRSCGLFVRSRQYQGKRINDKVISSFFVLRGYGYSLIGEPDLALADYNQSIKLNKSLSNGLALRGVLMSTSFFRPDLALEDYGEALRLAPKDAEVRTNRAFLLLDKGDLDGAISDIDQVIKSSPKYARAFQARGRYYTIKGDAARAAPDFERAKQLDPGSKNTFDFERTMIVRWMQYLKEIQDDQDAVNWSGPPLDSNRISR
jgi:tetratricopeptide (TPR) repeat protein